MSARGFGDCRRFCRAGLLAAAILLGGSAPGLSAPADFVHADGKRLVDGRGARFDVKGINLGNWLVPEGYMFRFTRARSPSEIAGVIEALVGPEQAARFWSEFRDRYIAEPDIRFIAAAGFNTVRVPLNWRLFVEPDADGADRFEGPGWLLVDRLVQWCRRIRLAGDPRSARRARRSDRRQSR